MNFEKIKLRLHHDIFLLQEPDHLPDKQVENNWQPCVLAIHNFASAFLFSVETQHTIGYGTRQTTERCPEAIFLESLQSVVGVIIQVLSFKDPEYRAPRIQHHTYYKEHAEIFVQFCKPKKIIN